MSYNGQKHYQAWCDDVLVGHIIANVPDSNYARITKVASMTAADDGSSFKRIQFDFELKQRCLKKYFDDSISNKLGIGSITELISFAFNQETVAEYAEVYQNYDPNLMQTMICAQWDVIEITPEVHDEIFDHDFFVPIETEADVNLERQELKFKSGKYSLESLKEHLNNQIIYGDSSSHIIFDEIIEQGGLSKIIEPSTYAASTPKSEYTVSIPKSDFFPIPRRPEPFYRTIEHAKSRLKY